MDYSSSVLADQIHQLQDQLQANQALLVDPSLAPLAREEISRLEKQIEALTLAQTISHEDVNPAAPTRSLGGGGATLEIRGAAGGDEAKIFAHDLENMYLRFANALGFKVEILDEGVIKVSGKSPGDLPAGRQGWPLSPFATFQYEAGVHRVQRVPVTESAGRIHTSTATVAVLPQVSAKQVDVNEADLIWEFIRAGGPGGQNVNKLSTAVRLTYKPTGDSILVRTERYQQRNKEIALELLRQRLWQREQDKLTDQIGAARSAIGTGSRSEKIRTYNYPQNRVTDHRINKSWHNLESIINGNLRDVVETLHQELNSHSQLT